MSRDQDSPYKNYVKEYMSFDSGGFDPEQENTFNTACESFQDGLNEQYISFSGNIDGGNEWIALEGFEARDRTELIEKFEPFVEYCNKLLAELKER